MPEPDSGSEGLWDNVGNRFIALVISVNFLFPFWQLPGSPKCFAVDEWVTDFKLHMGIKRREGRAEGGIFQSIDMFLILIKY